MYQAHISSIIPAVVGASIALIAFIAPFGNTGVDGTLGAGLVVLGSVAVTAMIGVMAIYPLTRGWFVTLGALALLAASLTAIAAFFLMQTLLLIAMAATLCVLIFLLFVSGKRAG
ncbi:MAG: hypothetical protein ACNA7O_08195 [Rhodobacterales bacterium]